MTSRGVSRTRNAKAHSATVKDTKTSKPRKQREFHGEAAANITSGTPLQLLIARRMVELDGKGPLSLRDVSARGGTGHRGRPLVSKATVANVLSGKVVALQPETITGLATALQLDESLIVKAIEQTREITMDVPERLKKLSPEAWEKLLDFGDYLLAQERKSRPNR